MLIDSHCHLDFPDFDDERDAVVARAHSSGVGAMVTICTKVSEFEKVRSISEDYPNVYCSVGVHPHEADEEGDIDVAGLITLAQHPKVVGIGETGLDYYYDHSGRAKQIKSLKTHIAASQETGLPLIVHTRDADEDMAQILTEEMSRKQFSGVLHCFSSSAALAETAISLGMFLSFSGILTFKNAGDLREIAGRVPIDRVLVETDAPYLAPTPNRGKRNEPSFVVHTANVLAEAMGRKIQDIEAQTTMNFFRLFSKAPAMSHTDDAT
jgi:TatD DNase family protein